MLNNFQKLNREALRKINGGGGIGPCDIAPIDCPCIVPPNHPCLGGSGGGGTDPVGYCANDHAYIPCDELCTNGTQPFCPA